MRMTALALGAALLLCACSQQGDGGAGGNDGVADPGLPGAGPARPVPIGGTPQPIGIPGVYGDPVTILRDCFSAEEQRRTPESLSAEERAAKISCINSRVAAQINPQLPARIDPVTMLTHVDSAGTTLTYIYRAEVDRSRLPPAAIEQVKTAARNNACTNPQMRQMLSYGGVYAYRWLDRTGRLLGELRIDGCR